MAKMETAEVAKKKNLATLVYEKAREALSIQTSVLVMPDHQDLVIHPVAIDTILTIILATPRPRKESLPSCFWTWTWILRFSTTARFVGVGMFHDGHRQPKL